ncbi:MAG: hypothetical protein SFT92_01525 [Rickettsiales bacterium]|nr:hypothetical protein [Rickettsiales bacterium]
MGLTQEQLSTSVANIIATAQTYINTHLGKEGDTRLLGNTPEETQEVATFLRNQPYQDNATLLAVSNIVKNTVDVFPPAGEMQPIVTYLGGAYGSKDILHAQAQSNASPTFKELKQLMSQSASIDFSQLKRSLENQTGMKPEPYAKWRPLFHGIDMQLHELALNAKRNVVVDNALAPINHDETMHMLTVLAQDEQKAQLRLYAVALTPNQAEALARAQNKSERDIAEAGESARNFCRFFMKNKDSFPHVTLVDSNGQVLYQHTPGRDKAHLQTQEYVSWVKECGAAVTMAPTIPSPAIQQAAQGL